MQSLAAAVVGPLFCCKLCTVYSALLCLQENGTGEKEPVHFDPFPDLPADFGPEVPDEGIDGLLFVSSTAVARGQLSAQQVLHVKLPCCTWCWL